MINLLLTYYYYSISIVPSFRDVCTLREFAWARMCVCSRNFGLIINGVRTAALVPYADMLNHYRPRETKWQFEDMRQGFTIITLNKISNGAQIYDSYGQKCNHRFLLNYGFSIENNTEEDGYCPNEVPLLFHLSKQDPLYDRKCTIWSRDNFIPSRRLRIGIIDNENYRYSLAMLRIIVANESDILKLQGGNGNINGNIGNGYNMNSYHFRLVRDIQQPIDIQNEIRAMKYFNEMCLDYLSRYKNTLQEDIELLSSGQLRPFSNERHAIIQLKGEKEILHFYLNFTNDVLYLFNLKPYKDLLLKYEEYKLTKHPMVCKYCQTVVMKLRANEERELELLQKQVDLTKPTVV